jgi:multidrug efflux pump subunit AcrB
VFTPIAFMGGIIGQFFYAFGLTVVFATLFSIFMSFTLAPLLAARLLRTGETADEEHSRLLGPDLAALGRDVRRAGAATAGLGGRWRGRSTAGS